MDKPPLIRRVVIHNYKSIAQCDVTLGRFNVLVGRNGAGKSNFLDALSFLSQSMKAGSVGLALHRRDGMEAVLRKGSLDGDSIKILVEIELTDRANNYSIEIKPEANNWFSISNERLTRSGPDEVIFECRNGLVAKAKDELLQGRSLSQESLLLPLAATMPECRPVFDAISNIAVFSPILHILKSPAIREPGITLRSNGGNLAAVIGRIERENPRLLDRITEYLSAVLPGMVRFQRVEVQGYETLQFIFKGRGSLPDYVLPANSVSDGTLRTLAILVAAMQSESGTVPARMACIEEPEMAVHPAAMAVLLDALREASVNTQILITTHSPDLLDRVDIETDSLFAVSDESGSTVIAPIDEASASAIRDHLYTPGELLRSNQLEPRIEASSAQAVAE